MKQPPVRGTLYKLDGEAEKVETLFSGIQDLGLLSLRLRPKCARTVAIP